MERRGRGVDEGQQVGSATASAAGASATAAPYRSGAVRVAWNGFAALRGTTGSGSSDHDTDGPTSSRTDKPRSHARDGLAHDARPPVAQGLYDPASSTTPAASPSSSTCTAGAATRSSRRASPPCATSSTAARRARRSTPATAPGILIQMPDRFLREVVDFDLPARGLLRHRHRLPAPGRRARPTPRPRRIEKIVASEGLRRPRLARRARRRLDARHDAPGGRCRPSASCSSPARRRALGGIDLERRAFVVRKRIEHEVRGARRPTPRVVYFPSLSCRTLVYKGMLTTPAARRVLPRPPRRAGRERASPWCTPASRTNTFPSWPLAHPYRYVAHNGEINTVQGNRNWMRAREALLAQRRCSARRPRAHLPDLHARRQRLGQLRRGARAAAPGRPLAAPRRADDDPRGVGEPRVDGPGQAGVLPVPRLADGAVGRPGVGRLHRRHGHRRGARPQRPAPVAATGSPSDGLVDHGVRGRRARHRPGDGRAEGPAPAGPHVPGRHRAGPHRRRRRDQGRPRRRAPLRASGSHDGLVHLDDLPDRPHIRYPHASTCVRRQQTFGYTHEELKILDRADGPHRRGGPRLDGHRHAHRRAVGPARGCCSTTSPSCSPRSPTRRSTPSARSWSPASAARSGPRATCSTPRPRRAARSCLPRPILDNDELAKLVHINDDGDLPGSSGRSSSTACTRWPRAATACATRSTGVRRRGVRRHRRRRQHHRPLRPRLRPRAGADPVAAAHRGGAPPPHPGEDPHPGRPRRRDRRRPRGAPHGLLLGLRRRRHQPVPGLRDDRGHDRPRRSSTASASTRPSRNYIKAAGKGVLKVMSKMGISTVASYTGAQVFEAIGLGQDLVDEYFTGTASRLGGIGLDELAAEVAARHALAYPDRPRSGPTASSRSAASTSGAARASTTSSTPRPSSSSSTPPAASRYDVFKEYTAAGRRPGRAAWPRCAACSRFAGRRARTPVPIDEVEPVVGDRQALLHRRHVLRLDLGRGPRDAGHRHEPPRRQVQHRRGRRGPRALRRPTPTATCAARAIKQVASGRFGVTSRVPHQRRRPPDQDGPGRQARRGRPAARPQGVPVDRQDPALHAGRRAHQPAAAPRHLLDRGPRPAHPRPQERQPRGPRPREAGGRGRASARSPPACPRPTPTWCSSPATTAAPGACPLTSLKHAGAPVGARPGRDPADAAAQRPARPHRRAGRRPAEDRPRRGHRRAARRRGVRLRHRAARRVGLRDDAGLPPRHLPGRRRHPEPGAARSGSPASPSSSRTSSSSSPRRCASCSPSSASARSPRPSATPRCSTPARPSTTGRRRGLDLSADPARARVGRSPTRTCHCTKEPGPRPRPGPRPAADRGRRRRARATARR